MPVEVAWDNLDCTIISQHFSGRWTWDEFYRVAYDQTRHMICSSAHVVHIIADIQGSYSTSMAGALTQVRKAAEAYPDNWGVIILVNKNSFINILIDLFKRTHPTWADRLFITATRDEAYAIIQQYENERVA